MFQSTRPRGARLHKVYPDAHAVQFQSTRPRGARPFWIGCSRRKRAFQSTRPRGARPMSACVFPDISRVSIHAPTRGATFTLTCGLLFSASFNPRAHAGRDTWPCIARSLGHSFNPRAHAGRDPSRSARHHNPISFNPRAHAGRDLFTANVLICRTSFNPRAHAGRDCRCAGIRASAGIVSIHAPTRGATQANVDCGKTGGGFQSTRPRGARRAQMEVFAKGLEFQSTRPRGARLGRAADFDTREGVSIHAPTRGATSILGGIFGGKTVSIHAPTRGATGDEVPQRQADCVSIHAPTRGATELTVGLGQDMARFNPRAHAGRDSAPPLSAFYGRRFNPRAHAGRDGNNAGYSGAQMVSIHAPTRGATR